MLGSHPQQAGERIELDQPALGNLPNKISLSEPGETLELWVTSNHVINRRLYTDVENTKRTCSSIKQICLIHSSLTMNSRTIIFISYHLFPEEISFDVPSQKQLDKSNGSQQFHACV